jgi:hypothetical protein
MADPTQPDQIHNPTILLSQIDPTQSDKIQTHLISLIITSTSQVISTLLWFSLIKLVAIISLPGLHSPN